VEAKPWKSVVHLGLRCFQDRNCLNGTDESLPRVDSSVPLTHHDPRDLGLICLEKKRKIRFGI